MFSLLPNTLRFVLASFLWTNQAPINDATRPLEFQLRHAHALSNDSRVIFSDISPSFGAAETWSVETRPVLTHRPPSLSEFSAARLRSMRHMQSESLLWREENVVGPDVEKRETLLQLAKMTSNSYFAPGDASWYDLGSDWNVTYSYGWEPDQDGFRGHVFVSTDESTVVLSIKGTSVPYIVGGPTTKKDKLNDNLLFSCCCARVGPTWSTVCGCYEGGYKCDLTCLEKSLVEESLFYPVGLNLYNNLTYKYPTANIWVIGHSLGGSLASLMGATFGAPVVAFEAPAERMAARRLHLPIPPSLNHITNVFHTADPIPMGQCTGVTSSCAAGGYALESQCHLGKLIRYDTVQKLGWSSSANNHPIKVIIEKLLNEDWEQGDAKKGVQPRAVPLPVEEDADCQDCFKWEIGEFRKNKTAKVELENV